MTKLDNKGFSLIELMIVVAIIGILSAIAIPNFQRFQMKSRQSEAKNALAAVYQAEKAFHQEWAQYFGDWKDIGYAPEGVMKYYVATSSDAARISPSVESGYMGPSGAINAPIDQNSGSYCDNAAVAAFSTCVKDFDYINAAVNGAAGGAAAALATNTFTAAAASDLDRGADGIYDTWTMDNTKRLTHAANDAAQ